MPRVVIAAGGTAGHVVPALAVADELRARGAEVSFLGTPGRAEARLVPAAGYEIDLISLRGLDRRNPLRAAGAAIRAAVAIPKVARLLRRRRADAVLGGGGYVAGPAGLAATAMRVPLVLTEADSHLGLANRLLAPAARRVCLAFPIRGREGERYVVTGRAVPAAILAADRTAARQRLGIPEGERCLLVFGGSLGAKRLNDVALEAFAGGESVPRQPAERRFHVVHITGSRDYAAARAHLESAGSADRYTLLELEPDLGEPLAAADLVVARAGGSVLELAAAGCPAILVPYPHATARHQHANAEWMGRAGAAIVIEDAELTAAGLTSLVARLLGDPDRLRRMAAASRSLARPDAAQRIADEVLQATTGSSSQHALGMLFGR